MEGMNLDEGQRVAGKDEETKNNGNRARLMLVFEETSATWTRDYLL